MTQGPSRDVADPASCVFYHTVELPTLGVQTGIWDLRGRFDDYVASTNLDGRSLLDIGTASGFLTFEAEARGATVTSLDAAEPEHHRSLPIHDSEYTRDKASWRTYTIGLLEGMRNAYWLCHREFGSSARCIYGDIYDIDPSIGVFDVVLLGQILIHLPDGISAVQAAANVCRDTIIITEGTFEDDSPRAGLAGRANKPELSQCWYQYSTGWYREVLTMLGFNEITFTTGLYPCHDEYHEKQIKLTTIVGSRPSKWRTLSRRITANIGSLSG